MSELRREFSLREEDRGYLDARGLPWETVKEGETNWLIIHGYPIHRGYNVETAIVALQIPTSYPTTQIDMVYFHPFLSRLDGGEIRQLSDQSLDGNVWQRWSRHRTDANPWRPDEDGVERHLLLVDEWLARALA